MSVVHHIASPEPALNQGQAKAAALEAMLNVRDLPDYTWPQRLPLDVLRRLVEREIRDAADLAIETFPTWGLAA